MNDEIFIEGIADNELSLLVEGLENGNLNGYDIEGWGFKSLWKKVKKVAKKAVKTAANTYAPIVKTIIKATDSVPGLTSALTAINPAIGGVAIGSKVFKDMMTFEKKTGKKIKFGTKAIKGTYDQGYIKGYKDALSDFRGGAITVKGKEVVTTGKETKRSGRTARRRRVKRR